MGDKFQCPAGDTIAAPDIRYNQIHSFTKDFV